MRYAREKFIILHRYNYWSIKSSIYSNTRINDPMRWRRWFLFLITWILYLSPRWTIFFIIWSLYLSPWWSLLLIIWILYLSPRWSIFPITRFWYLSPRWSVFPIPYISYFPQRWSVFFIIWRLYLSPRCISLNCIFNFTVFFGICFCICVQRWPPVTVFSLFRNWQGETNCGKNLRRSPHSRKLENYQIW